MRTRSSSKGTSSVEQPVEKISVEKLKDKKDMADTERVEMDTPMINNVRAAVTTPGSAITEQFLGNGFSVKGHHMQAIRDNQFDGVVRADPHKHLCDYEDLSSHFHYGVQMQLS